MAFDDFSNPPRHALNCAQWRDGPHARRHGGAANERRAQIRADDGERARRVRQYARDHRCSEAEAEADLFGDD